MLTGKCKEDFEKWYISSFNKGKINTIPLKDIPWETIGFESLDLSMQLGVYIDFFDTVSIDIWTFPMYFNRAIGLSEKVGYCYHVNGDNIEDEFKTITEARTKAIEKANVIYNSKSE